MKKNTLYFPHDYHARNDLKLVKLQMEMGSLGIGVYWQLIEMLYEAGGTLPMQCDRIAYVMREQCGVILQVISDFELFRIEGDIFYSEAVLRRLEVINQKSEKAKESAHIRWAREKGKCERKAIVLR